MSLLFLFYWMGTGCLAIGLVLEVGYLCFGKEPSFLAEGLTDAGMVITLGVICWCLYSIATVWL